MKSKYVVLLTVLAALFLLSCFPDVSETAPLPEPASESQWGSIQPSSRVKDPAPNAKIIELLEKNKDATNYHYVFDAEKADGYEVFISGSKVKKVYAEAKPLRGDVFYNTIYLNQETRTAIGTCTKPGISCGAIWNKAYVVDYDLENIGSTPVEIIQGVRSPQEVGSEVLMNRALTIIGYINMGGKRERLSLDNYYGLPSRQVIYSANDEIEESHTFTRLSVGEVQDEEVTLPEEYGLQE